MERMRVSNPKNRHVSKKGSCERDWFRSLYLLILTISLFIIFTDNVAATIESTGPGGYGWQQVYTNTSPTTWYRLTGSSDRQYYDWGYKNISISGRMENYWSKDCGWWYVSDESTLNITLIDAAGDYLTINESATTTKGQTGEQSYSWSFDDDPGLWNVTVTDGTLTSNFYIYVRGQLKVTSITVSPTTPSTGQTVAINATLKDNAGNLINGSAVDNNGISVAPTVRAYIIGGGEDIEITLSDDGDDGIWNGTFTPQKYGDHKIIVKASDGHKYWIDGRGSTTVAVTGIFPSAFGGSGASIIKVILMIFLAFKLIKSASSKSGTVRKAMSLLIFTGSR